MQTILLFLSFIYAFSVYSQTDSIAYIESIEKYIYTYEQDSLELDLHYIETDGLISKKKFKLFQKTIGGFSEYTAWNEKNNQYFNFQYGSNYFNRRKYEDLYLSLYFRDNRLVKYIKEIENKKYTYKTIVYFKDEELVSIETNEPNFNIEEVRRHEKEAIEILEMEIKSRNEY
ncbi:MAG TPA: hypothetical protein VKY32_04300 [Flavobacterium sp.]|nr:hypothetical protein [Flavobacterium sp.]